MPHSVRADRPRTPQAVFDRIAPYYDTLNGLLSVGMDRRWRKETVLSLGLHPGEHVLDVATGTGALATAIARMSSGTVSVTGCDTNERMLAVARRRAKHAHAHVEYIACDATNLPFPKNSFQAATIGFAIDDMDDRAACVREVWRVLCPGGLVAILELSQPHAGPIKAAYRAYLRTFRLLGRLSFDGYTHLEQEILQYRGADAVKDLLSNGGFSRYRRTDLTWGIARLHVAEKVDFSQDDTLQRGQIT
jgi:demethylmenaquinone methyltransferase/2-methoxy-6-polyprenyl-1,4-benzoquinol methylase